MRVFNVYVGLVKGSMHPVEQKFDGTKELLHRQSATVLAR